MLAAVLALRPESLLRFRPRLFDLPALLWCTCPLLSSPVNGLEVYDGFSQSLANTIQWGIPYLLGRCLFAAPQSLADLLRVMFYGTLAYAPLCLAEVRLESSYAKLVSWQS